MTIRRPRYISVFISLYLHIFFSLLYVAIILSYLYFHIFTSLHFSVSRGKKFYSAEHIVTWSPFATFSSRITVYDGANAKWQRAPCFESGRIFRVSLSLRRLIQSSRDALAAGVVSAPDELKRPYQYTFIPFRSVTGDFVRCGAPFRYRLFVLRMRISPHGSSKVRCNGVPPQAYLAN